MTHQQQDFLLAALATSIIAFVISQTITASSDSVISHSGPEATAITIGFMSGRQYVLRNHGERGQATSAIWSTRILECLSIATIIAGLIALREGRISRDDDGSQLRGAIGGFTISSIVMTLWELLSMLSFMPSGPRPNIEDLTLRDRQGIATLASISTTSTALIVSAASNPLLLVITIYAGIINLAAAMTLKGWLPYTVRQIAPRIETYLTTQTLSRIEPTLPVIAEMLICAIANSKLRSNISSGTAILYALSIGLLALAAIKISENMPCTRPRLARVFQRLNLFPLTPPLIGPTAAAAA